MNVPLNFRSRKQLKSADPLQHITLALFHGIFKSFPEFTPRSEWFRVQYDVFSAALRRRKRENQRKYCIPNIPTVYPDLGLCFSTSAPTPTLRHYLPSSPGEPNQIISRSEVNKIMICFPFLPSSASKNGSTQIQIC